MAWWLLAAGWHALNRNRVISTSYYKCFSKTNFSIAYQISSFSIWLLSDALPPNTHRYMLNEMSTSLNVCPFFIAAHNDGQLVQWQNMSLTS